MTTDPAYEPTPTPYGYNAEDLTAFALDELDPDSDAHHKIVAALANDPAIRAEIDAIKHSAAAVRDALAHEPVSATSGTGILPVTASPHRQDACATHKLRVKTKPPLFARPALLAAGFALAAGAAVAVVSMLQPGPGPGHTPIADRATAPRGIDAIHAALQSPVTASFQDAPLREVLDEVQRTTHAELHIDWDALAERGVSPETRLTFDADGLPARDLLSLALAAAWQQLPHPDPAVWSVGPEAVHIEPRSSLVLRSLAQAQTALAAANPTDNRLTPRQATLADHPAWQRPGEVTVLMRLQAEVHNARASYESDYEREAGMRSAGDERYRYESEVRHLREARRSSPQYAQDTDGLPTLDLYAVRSAGAVLATERVSGLPAGQAGTSLYYMEGLGVAAGDGLLRQGGRGRYDRAAEGVTLGVPVQTRAGQLGRPMHLDAGVTGGVAPASPPAAAPTPARGAGGLRDRSGSAGRELERGETVLAEDLVTAGIEPEESNRPDDAELGDKLATLQEQQAQLQQRLVEFQRPGVDPNQLTRDTYALVNDNPFRTGLNDPLSTFSVDVDTAAYTLVRRQVQQQRSAPVPGAVRIEELINYFDYRYTAPVVEPEMLDHGVVTQASIQRLAADDDSFAPFATHVEVADCPWAEGHQLVRIGIKGMEVAQEDRPAAHLTFLLDVSGSMSSDNKLPLVKESMRLLLTQLNPEDHVSIVVYAGAAGLVLENASAGDPAAIEDALNKLSAGGSTAGGAGIELAYRVAQDHYVPGGVNRVILCTDGDFNVGISDRDQLVELIKQKANPEPDADGNPRGVYLSVLGYGMGNLNDHMMEPLTNAGNGHYAYIDSAEEAQKVMVEQVGGTLVAIAKDVKVQVEFNPSRVLAYRLIGYENRVLAAEDFANDTVDAGDIGAGHTVTALYEVVPFPDDGLGDEEALRQVKLQLEALDAALAFSTSVLENTPLTDEQYRKLAGSIRLMQQQRDVAAAVQSRAKRVPPAVTAAGGIAMRYRDDTGFIDGLDALEELMVVNLRYKPVDAPAEQGTSRLIQTAVGLDAVPFSEASEDTRFAAAVAGFGMVLRNSPHRGDASMQWVIDTAGDALTHDPHGYRAGFVALAEQAATLLPDDAENDRNVLKPVDGREPIRER